MTAKGIMWSAEQMLENKPNPAQVQALSHLIQPLLGGHHPAVQGAALADLLSLWIAGNIGQDPEELLAMHMTYVRELIPESRKEIEAMMKKAKKKG